MLKHALIWTLAMLPGLAWSGEQPHDMQVNVKREGDRYAFTASFDTTLSQCAAYQYLTDYDAAKQLPGVVESNAVRESANKVMVKRVADETVLFFKIRMRSTMEYTEKPFDGVDFTQLSGDSKMFRGNWAIEPNPQGSRLTFTGFWEPDTVIPLFVIDHFAEHGLIKRFNAIADLAEQRKALETSRCTVREMAHNEQPAHPDIHQGF